MSKQTPAEQFVLEEFFNYLSVEKGLAPNTLEAYRQDLTAYKHFFEKQKLKDWARVKRQDILKFILQEKNRGLNATSIARRLVAIKLFHRFLVQEHYLKDDVTSVLESPKLWKKLPQFLTSDEMKAILKAPAGKDPVVLRDRAILETLMPLAFGFLKLPSLKSVM